MRRLLALLAALPLLAVACNSSGGSKPVAAPKGLPPFYAVPADVSHQSPGDLLKSEPVSVPEVNGTVERVMYVSQDAKGKPAAVTGLVFVPALPAPPAGYPVVTWAHGTNGMAAACTPSLKASTAVASPTVINAMLGLGWIVAATDYQGEGTPPGLLPFLVGDVAARNTVDIVRAARQLPTAHAGPDYIVWGHSEGGQAALFAWSMAGSYGARDGIHMVGAVAVAPPSQLEDVYQHLSGTADRVYAYMMLAGFNAAYGNRSAPLDAVLTSKGSALLPKLRTACLGPLAAVVNGSPFAQLVKTSPFTLPAWRQLFTQNDPASFATANQVPLLIVHGAADELIPVTTSAQLTDHLCSLGANVERWVYPDQNHGGVLFASVLDMGHWMQNRFQDSSTPYQPTGVPGVEVHTCR